MSSGWQSSSLPRRCTTYAERRRCINQKCNLNSSNMKAIFVSCLTAFCLMALPFPAAAAVYQEAPADLVAESLSREQLEQSLGRKLKFKERIALSLFKHRMKRAAKKNDEKELNLLAFFGFWLTLLGVLFFPLAIAGGVLCIVALGQFKKEPDRWKGKGWALAGVILAGISVLAALLLVGLFLALLSVSA